MTKPSALNGQLTKWAMLLSQYDIHFLPQKATKGQAIADLLAENPRSKSATLFEELPDETTEVHSSQVNPTVWQMYFDGASRTIPRAGLVVGVGVVFISPQNTLFRTHSPSLNLAPTMLQSTMPCSLVCNWYTGSG